MMVGKARRQENVVGKLWFFGVEGGPGGGNTVLGDEIEMVLVE